MSYDELVEIELLFKSKINRYALAFAEDGESLDKEPIVLKSRDIQIQETGRKEAGLPIVIVSMKQHIAEKYNLV